VLGILAIIEELSGTMHRDIPITRDLVLLGGGHAHALVLRKWAMDPLPGVRVTLVDPNVKAPYTGMLPGYIAGHYQRDELDIDLVRLARQANARLIIDQASGLDLAAKRVHLQDRPDIAYDTLSVDIGISSKRPELAGSDQPIIPAKPLGTLAAAWQGLLAECALEQIVPKIVIIGAGVAGVELALSMSYRLKQTNLFEASVTVIEAKDTPLSELNPMARRNLLQELAQANIRVICNARISQISKDNIRLDSGEKPVSANFIVSTAGAQPHAWLAQTGLTLERGFICMDQSLRAHQYQNVFAAGDCAHLTYAPRPKAGVFAVRQAPVLFNNLKASLSGGAMTVYRPQKSYLKLISKGRKSAVTDKWGIGLAGSWVWQIKNRIDRAFMTQFRGVTEMSPPPIPKLVADGVSSLLDQTKNPCGACGAKIAQAPLLKGLDQTDASARDDAAIVTTGGHTQIISTDHLRAFGHDAYLLAKIAAVHALGDIWAMGAQPTSALSHIILSPLAPAKQAEVIKEINAGAISIFEACGAEIVGGHTSSGAELTIGFTVIGSAETHAITLNNAQPGDVLVITKPIGTGVILAAEMQQRVDGEDYQTALASMCRLQGQASHLLARYATAMTDVTGFGLGGHLISIMDASGVGVHLDLGAVPVLPGAERLAEAGIKSTLWSQNASCKDKLSLPDSPRADLIFDPQTCGGLLAAIPADKIDALVADFQTKAEPLWRIGEIKAAV
jgi:selenide,water dikinase